LPLLRSHNRRQFEIHCYDNASKPDELNARLRACVDGWRSIAGLNDQACAEMIRQDKIDILVDLSLHMAGNRMLVFALKPAPVQATYLAYCSTSGMDGIDYRLTDPHLDPSAANDAFYSERSMRLPRSYWCYEPGIPTPDANELPAKRRGQITFGCLNNFCKISLPTRELWARLMNRCADSRLLLHCHPGSHRDELREFFQSRGIDEKRIDFVAGVPLADYFRIYHQIDICLDPLTYGGGTTTCDAMWMGVPVVTLPGQTAVSRSGLSLLTNVGLIELIAKSRDDYIHIAASLASDSDRLSELRHTLRRRMLESPLTDAKQFADAIEGVYRQMWKQWSEYNQTR
jgi:protein O-GlcNAc transferase